MIDLVSKPVSTSGTGVFRPGSFLSQWPFWFAPALLALGLAIYFQDPFAGEWDGVDYTVLAVNRWFPSPMLLGRILFLYVNRIAYLFAHNFFGLPIYEAFVLFKTIVIVETPLAVIALWMLARELTKSIKAATLAALILCMSPFFVYMSGQVMAEIPSILVMCAAMLMHLSGLKRRSNLLVVLGAVLLGLGVNVREGVALFGTWLVLAPFVYGYRWKRKSIQLIVVSSIAFLLCALVPFSIWFGLDLEGYRQAWFNHFAGTSREGALFPVSWSNASSLLHWMWVTSPLVVGLLPFAMWHEWRSRGVTPLLLMAAIGLFATLSLLSHYSMVINGRYCLTGLPAMVPIVAAFVLHLFETGFSHLQQKPHVERIAAKSNRLAFACALLLTVGVGCFSIQSFSCPIRFAQSMHGMWNCYIANLYQIPKENSVVMAGNMTVAVIYYRGLGLGNWDHIGTGCGWPGDDKLVGVIQEHHKNKKRVFLDLDRYLWPKKGWGRHETDTIATLDQHFRFRRTRANTVYEVCPMSDLSATEKIDVGKIIFDHTDFR